jgi:hypothetical protein
MHTAMALAIALILTPVIAVLYTGDGYCVGASFWVSAINCSMACTVWDWFQS